MNFNDVIAQEDVKNRLRQQVDTDHLPHALLLSGPQGSGKLALALALGRYMLCEHPENGEPCETCHSCRMTQQWGHPDFHFSFPVIKQKSDEQPVSDDYVNEWRRQLNEQVYFDQNDWLKRLKAENQQLQFYVGESDALQHKLALKSSQGGRRVVLIWLPEKMPDATANKLLKLVEEPPSHVYFLMVSNQPDQVLGTIFSRTQRMHVPALTEAEIADALIQRSDLTPEEAQHLAHLAQGSYTKALKQMQEEGEEKEFFDLFVELMRFSYARKIKDMKAWSDKVAKMGRERQKRLLEYFQHLVRENFVYNFQRQDSLNYMSTEESQFAVNFARFINERNVIPMTQVLADCQRDIEQNVNAKMVFFDYTIKMIILLKQ